LSATFSKSSVASILLCLVAYPRTAWLEEWSHEGYLIEGTPMYLLSKCGLAGLALALVLFGLPSSSPAWIFGEVVTIEQLSFHPDSITVPCDSFAVLVVQNREEAPILHEVTSQNLFESGTLIQVLRSEEHTSELQSPD